MGLSLGTEFDDPHTQGLLQLGLGLLGSRGNFAQSLAQGGQQGLLGYQQAAQQKSQREQQNLQRKMQEMQLSQAQQAQLRQQQLQELAQRSARSPQQMAMQQHGGPTIAAANASATGQTPAGFDWAGYANGLAAIDPPAAMQMQLSMKKEQPKIKDVQVMTDPATGKALNVFVFEDGTTKVAPYGTKPDMVMQNLGNRVLAIDKNATPSGATFQMGASPDAQLSSRTQFGVAGITDKRERDLAGTRVQYIDMPDGSKRAMPTQIVGPQAQVNGIPVGGPTKDNVSAERVNAILDQAEPLLKDSTGSYGGKALDMLGQVFGAATDGSIAAGRLRVLEGRLMMAQPRMEGPQSDKDVAMYRQMAAQIGDDTVPYAIKAAAAAELRRLGDKYASNRPGSGGPPLSPWAPAPAGRSGIVDFGSLK
jgi:hypothetical protein